MDRFLGLDTLMSSVGIKSAKDFEAYYKSVLEAGAAPLIIPPSAPSSTAMPIRRSISHTTCLRLWTTSL